jgi:predicted dehydrogenase
MNNRSTRRDFLRQTALAGAGFWVAGSNSPGAARSSPLEKLNVAFVGVGGRGAHNLAAISGENVVALVDVDEQALARAAVRHPKAKKLHDFRRLFDSARDFDAVVVSTTEHTHAFATLPALKLNKHVYCEKPLAHSVEETRLVAQEAGKRKVATQMGTQIHAGDNYRRVVEVIAAGAVGPVKEVHVWVSRGGPGWGGGDRPRDKHAPPKHLHWDLWLGPAPWRPYHPTYVPGPKWYKWWDFGGGVLPDLGSHWNDLPFWALKLTHPSTIEAEGPKPHPETAPPWLIVRYQFPARDKMPAVKLTWYQGGRKPELVTGKRVPAWDSGVLFVGERGLLLADYFRHALLPREKFADYERPAPSIPRSIGHHAEWVLACKTGKPTTCPFHYSGPLTEANLLGNVAYRVGKKLAWDPVKLAVKDCPEADRYLRKEYRKGWSLV